MVDVFCFAQLDIFRLKCRGAMATSDDMSSLATGTDRRMGGQMRQQYGA